MTMCVFRSLQDTHILSLSIQSTLLLMPGPKMGPRPPDFDEALVRAAPTFQKWLSLPTGAKLRYACREFVRGHGDDEERLMRRIMIARRNNLRDHATLKKARQRARGKADVPLQPAKKQRKASSGLTDSEVTKEMDVLAVEATRSYRKWMSLQDGQEFVYNQKYVKGKDGHDWLLRKNIWRRMRYRRENKKMVEILKVQAEGAPEVAAGIVDHALLANASAATTNTTDEEPSPDAAGFVHKSVVEAAVAAAEQYAKTEASMTTIPSVVHNPLEAAATDEALAAAAKIAAAAAGGDDDEVAKIAAVAAAGANDMVEETTQVEVAEV